MTVANADGCADIIDARRAAAFIDARFDLVFPNSERVVSYSEVIQFDRLSANRRLSGRRVVSHKKG